MVGNGGREHALAWKLSQSPKVSEIYVASGNAGTQIFANNIEIDPTNIKDLAQFALKTKIDLTLVGSDNALALGIVDEFQKLGLKIWGPNQTAAQIESSKSFAKSLMKEHGIPTAEFEVFNNLTDALNRIKNKDFPVVIKANGLALGKGVQILQPTLLAMQRKGMPFSGLLYPGCIITKNGPKVLEFNARFGDPETQSYMRLLKTDLLNIIHASLEGKLNEISIEWHSGYACCIVLASAGYPGNYKNGFVIEGIENAEKLSGIEIFHAGTKYLSGKFLTNGGRVLGVTAIGNTLQQALDKAYEAIKLIHFEGMQYRKDIGAKALNI